MPPSYNFEQNFTYWGIGFFRVTPFLALRLTRLATFLLFLQMRDYPFLVKAAYSRAWARAADAHFALCFACPSPSDQESSEGVTGDKATLLLSAGRICLSALRREVLLLN